MRYLLALQDNPRPKSVYGAEINVLKPDHQVVFELDNNIFGVSTAVDFVSQDAFVDFIIRSGPCLVIVKPNILNPIIILQGNSYEILY